MRFDQLLPSPFYRVAIKAIIQDKSSRLLLVRTFEGWEMPGGGWEHSESFEECLKREIYEELGVQLISHSDILFTYKGRNIKNYFALRLIVRAELSSLDIHPTVNDILETKFVAKEELLGLEMSDDEAPIRDFSDIIWSSTSLKKQG
ncbi:NUDIX hydrolase [Candidatus Saccharibacteria bacterium]|nr:NUDIX hydrolase [Candidatus Saccharibacteria bacterium]